MNIDLPTSLARRADSVDPPHIDASAVVARGEQLVRRRRRLVAAGASAVAALAVGITALSDGRVERVDPATDHGVARAVVYGDGPVLHLDDRQIDTGLDYLSIDVTDDGAVLTTFDGGIWFTDGTVVERVGATLGLRANTRDGLSVPVPVGRPRDWVVNDSSGSLAAWVGYPDGDRDRPELVVYDTARRAVALRRPLDGRDEDGHRVVRNVAAVAGREVFVSSTSFNGVTDLMVVRYSLEAGTAEPVDRGVMEGAVRAVPRAVALGRVAEYEDLALHLARAWDPHHLDRIEVSDGVATLSDAGTGRVLDLRLPAPSPTAVWVVQWIDDNRIVLVTGQSPEGDLLTCDLSTLTCDVTIQDSAWGEDAPIIPGFGGDAADAALWRAALASRGLTFADP